MPTTNEAGRPRQQPKTTVKQAAFLAYLPIHLGQPTRSTLAIVAAANELIEAQYASLTQVQLSPGDYLFTISIVPVPSHLSAAADAAPAGLSGKESE